MSMLFKRELPPARIVKEMYPLSAQSAAVKEENDRAIGAVFRGESDKFLMIIGPCSADREDAVLEYILRLRKLQDKVADKILMIPRIYTNKPRTTGEGYKGMLHQPDPDSAPDMLKGIISIRKVHLRALEESGFSSADEMLYPVNYPYLSDVLSYVAVGARSVENQTHRLVASGLDIPVGMKNPTGGMLSVMMNAIRAAQKPHTFVFSGWEVKSTGNPLTHAILRGYSHKQGNSAPNYHYEDLKFVHELYEKSGLTNPAVIIDTNHANSNKKFDQQPRIAKEVLHSMRLSPEIRSLVKGLMVESYLKDGSCPPGQAAYGQSITDPCLGWEKTERMILEIADLL